MYDESMMLEIATLYKTLMANAEQSDNPYRMVSDIEKLSSSLNRLSIQVDPDTRAQIQRAGGYNEWKLVVDQNN